MTPLHDWMISCLYSDRPNTFQGSEVISDLISWKDIEYCINNPWSYWPRVLDKDTGKEIRLGKSKTYWFHKIPKKEEVVKHFKDGHTLQLGSYSVHNPTVNNLCKVIEEECDVEADMHVYCSREKSSSFCAHWDSPSNFILQVEGQTGWKVFDRIGVYGKVYEKEENLGPPIIDVILNPGDILYIPKMMYHKANPFEKRISISIPCVPGTAMDRNYFEL